MTLKIVQIKPELKGLRDVDHLGLSQSDNRYLSQNGYGLQHVRHRHSDQWTLRLIGPYFR